MCWGAARCLEQKITDEMLGGIAPYRRGHLDLPGEYHLKIKKQRSRQAHQLF